MTVRDSIIWVALTAGKGCSPKTETRRSATGLGAPKRWNIHELLKSPYDCFYEPLPEVRLRQEIEDCHQALTAALNKPERLMVLHIIDAEEQITGDISTDSFIAGFVWCGG